MSNVFTVQALASKLSLDTEYLRARGAADSEDGVVIPYDSDHSGHLLITADGKRHREGSRSPKTFGWNEARSQDREDLLVVASELGQLALGRSGFRSVATAEVGDLDSFGATA